MHLNRRVSKFWHVSINVHLTVGYPLLIRYGAFIYTGEKYFCAVMGKLHEPQLHFIFDTSAVLNLNRILLLLLIGDFRARTFANVSVFNRPISIM